MSTENRTSANRTAANRANARHSTGPTSAAGKAASSQNARKHGLTSDLIVFYDDDKPKYDELYRSLWRAWRPEGAKEEIIFARMVADNWRLQRAIEIERDWMGSATLKGVQQGLAARILALHVPGRPAPQRLSLEGRGQGEGVSSARPLLGDVIKPYFDDGSFERLRRYEARIERNISRLTRQLEYHQDQRIAYGIRDNEPDPDDADGPMECGGIDAALDRTSSPAPQPTAPEMLAEKMQNEAKPASANPASSDRPWPQRWSTRYSGATNAIAEYIVEYARSEGLAPDAVYHDWVRQGFITPLEGTDPSDQKPKSEGGQMKRE
jgi:hypothetical protein